MRLDPPQPWGDGAVALRALEAKDAEPYAAAFRDDPHLGRLWGAEQDPDAAAVREMAARGPERAEEGRGLQLALLAEPQDAFAGVISLHAFSWEHRRCEVGFWVAPQKRRRGLASAGVSLALDWLFGELELERVEMTTTPENAAVPGLAARLGFTREGLLRARNLERGQRVDIVWFGLLRDEWRRR